ncbi:ArsO family NAD(P)H-dependent flavin-containing monooxygenase [Granulicoccus phenolivorans]|uniref:ArsO family NAD(P)H-dependent flavin-containing monooxygenase n=1 Tax=Granulicoccus phenolivorans TaxID=266854 RepID=UPI00047A844F|nr:ArsO family NAD(P)H-dependent flavin-containing monooxygenase [Granulicoccus phenolivorans]
MVDVVVIGGGQAGLAAGYFLRRAELDFVILDAHAQPGGAWQHGWDSLRLFSPAEFGRLPGWPMPPQAGEGFPTAGHVVDYLTRYELRYDLPVRRPVRVHRVGRTGRQWTVDTDHGTWHSTAVISATGTWHRPNRPCYPGQATFTGQQLHTVDYRRPDPFAGQRVLIVGGGNSAAQILAEVSTVAETTWVTARPPRFMPDDVDGRVLFDVASARTAAERAGLPQQEGVSALGDIVMVPPVLAARARGVLTAREMFDHFDSTGVAWADGTRWACDTVIWCTGFHPDLDHLSRLRLTWQDDHPVTSGTRSLEQPGLHLLGYGDWTGPSSATLIGASRTAKQAVAEIRDYVLEVRSAPVS